MLANQCTAYFYNLSGCRMPLPHRVGGGSHMATTLFWDKRREQLSVLMSQDILGMQKYQFIDAGLQLRYGVFACASAWKDFTKLASTNTKI